MSAAFDALLACMNPTFVVLAEIQPAQALGPWTKVGGLTKTYSTPWSQYAATDVVTGGIYRRLDQVRQDATNLTSQTSSANVDANAGSYFFDSANSVIYVSMTDSASPETWAFVGAWFTIFSASQSVSFSDQPLYEPRLAESLPTLDSEKPDLLFGVTISDNGTLGLVNTDKLFDKLSRQWIWRNKLVTFKLGGTNGDTGVALAYSDYANIGAMQINTATPNDDLFTLQLDAIGSVLNQSIPPLTIADAYGYIIDVSANPNAASLPWLIGTSKDCKLVYVGTAGGNDTYAVDDPALVDYDLQNTFYAVNKTTGAKTVLGFGTDWNVGSPGSITVNSASWTYQTYEIWMDGDWSTLASTFGAIVTKLLTTLGVSSSKISSANFSTLDAVSPTLGVYLTVATQAAAVMRTLEQSMYAQLYVGLDGLWTCRQFDPSTSTTALVDADFATWQVEEDLSTALDEVLVQYDHRNASGAYFQTSQSDSSVQYGAETSDSTSLPTYLRNSADASNLASHMLFLRSVAPARITTELRGLQLMTASAGDMVAITRARGPIARTGTLDGQIFEIVKLTKVLGPTPTVTAVLEDLGGQTDRIFRLAPSGYGSTWSTASAADKAIYGFLSDDNGYLDATDILTRNGKVLW